MKFSLLKVGGIPLLFVLLAGAGALAQNAAVSGTAPTVTEIEVQFAGPSTLSRERILANMRTAVGKPYSEEAVEGDIRNLYATGIISNVRIFGEPVANGVKVVVVVQTKATVDEVRLEGVTKVKASSLRKELSVKPGETLTESNLEQDRQKIITYYESRGYSGMDVQYKIDTDEKTGKGRVIFTVNEGGKTSIRRIDFEGNQAFSDKELRKAVKTRGRNLLSFITKAGRINNEQLEQDIASLREWYQNHGYIDVEIPSAESVSVGEGKIDVVFHIKEGIPYKVGRVSIAGAQVFSVDELRKDMKTREGAVYSPKTVRDDAKVISNMYGGRGYIDLDANAETVPGGPGVIDVAFKLNEGAQSYVERVNVIGNTRTKDKVIRRELAVAPGDLYDSVKVDASRKRLENTNYFARVDAYPTNTLAPDRKDMNIRVEEKRTGSFNFGAGFSSIDNLLGFAEIQQGNFDIGRWPHLTGGGQKFRTRVSYGTQRKDFVIALTEPWFFDYKLAVGGEVFYREANFQSKVYSQRNYGFELNAKKEIARFTSARLAYRLEDISIYDLDDDVSDLIREEEGSRIKSSVTTGVSYDTRDNPFLSTKGQRVDFTTFVAGGPLGGDTDVYGFDLEGTQYFSLPWKTIFLINGELATVDTWAGGDRVPIFDRLYLGGSNNLRGFRYRDVGPKDVNGEAIGGKSLARLTFEYTFPVIERVRGALFYDVGVINESSYDLNLSDTNSDVGFGVRLDLPIGPVRLDYGIPLQSDEFNDSSGKFNFNIGYQF